MTGWKYISSDAAWHFFDKGQSLCALFKVKKPFTPRQPEPEDACVKCLQLSPKENDECPSDCKQSH